MIFKRILIYILSRFINFDSISEMFPVSVKSILIDDQRVLLIKNERDEWDLPGGKMEKNDNVIETLIREVKEELNIIIDNYNILQVQKYLFRKQEIIVVTYFSEITNEDPIILSFENIDYQFFSYDKLNELKLTPWAKDSLDKFKNKIN
jgi:8-oxo-dGTP pyrophosphatase MutT (NUDIX family)